jgi:hypothetical protein
MVGSTGAPRQAADSVRPVNIGRAALSCKGRRGARLRVFQEMLQARLHYVRLFEVAEVPGAF